MRRCLIVPILVIAACGCGRRVAPPPDHDSEKAHAAIVAALDAWKKGDAHSLPQRTPPIRFVDDDLLAGLRLADYELEEPDAPIRLHEDVPVILSLRDAQGKTVRREARYQVATSPGLAVLRSDR